MASESERPDELDPLGAGPPTPGSEPPSEVVEHPPPRWAAPVFALLGVGLVPWTVVLALTLPRHHGTRHYDVAWTGFDVALAAALLATAVGAARRATWLQASASVAATLLVTDAWFDVLSATSRAELATSGALALFVELPLAVTCVFVARHSKETADRARRLAALARWRRGSRSTTS